MRTRYLSAAVLASLSCVLTASCVQSPTTTPETDPGGPREAQRPDDTEPIGEAQQESGRGYQSKDFPFVVYVKDDGKNAAGGMQKADATLHFVERDWLVPVYFWQCRIQIQMPIRSAAEGTITPSRAALYPVAVADAVVDPLLASKAAWRGQGAAFCVELHEHMNAMFSALYPKLGARVLLNP